MGAIENLWKEIRSIQSLPKGLSRMPIDSNMQPAHNQVRDLFEYRCENLYWKEARANNGVKAGDLAGWVTINGYRSIQINDKNYLAHRLVFLYHHGFLPEYLDHIDGDKLNNDITNLREATHQENCRNAKKGKCYGGKPTSSRFKGCCWDKQTKKWIARIMIGGKTKHLGRFISEIEAAETYNRAAIELFGEFAYLNIISQPTPLNTMPTNRHITD